MYHRNEYEVENKRKIISIIAQTNQAGERKKKSEIKLIKQCQK
jgi:hypothetical protein